MSGDVIAVVSAGVGRHLNHSTAGWAHAAAGIRAFDLVGAGFVDLAELELELVHEARRARVPVAVLVALPAELDRASFLPSGTIPQAPEGIGLEFCILNCPECRITI